jgi:hypothetical protein
MNWGFYHARIKKGKKDNCLPHSTAVIVFIPALPCHCCISPLSLCKRSYPSTAAMGKSGSSVAGTVAGAVKKAKTSTKAADSDAPTVENWVQTKFLERDL